MSNALTELASLARAAEPGSAAQRSAVERLLASPTAWVEPLVDILPALAGEAAHLAATAIARRAAGDTSPALVRGLAWVFLGGDLSAIEVAIEAGGVLDAPELLRPLLIAAQVWSAYDGSPILLVADARKVGTGASFAAHIARHGERLRELVDDPDAGVARVARWHVASVIRTRQMQTPAGRREVSLARSQRRATTAIDVQLLAQRRPPSITAMGVHAGSGRAIVATPLGLHHIDLRTGHEVRTDAVGVEHVAVSGDGKLFAFARRADRPGELELELRRYDPPQQIRRMTLAASIDRIALSTDGHWLAVSGTTTRMIGVFSGLDKVLPSRCVALGPKGFVAIAAANGVQLWDLERGVLALTIPIQGAVSSLAWTADGSRLAIATGRELAICASRTGAVVARHALDDQQARLVFRPDGSALAARGTSSVRLWDLARGRVRDVPGEHVVAIGWTAAELVIARREGVIELWSPTGEAPLRRIEPGSEPRWRDARQIAFTDHGELVLITTHGLAARRFVLDDALCVRSEGARSAIEPSGRYAGDGAVAVVRVAEDRDAYDAHGYLGEVELLDTTGSRTALRRGTAWPGHGLSAVTIDRRATRFAAAAADGEVGIFWAYLTGAPPAIEAPTSITRTNLVKPVLLALDDDGTRIVVIDERGGVEVWDPVFGVELAKFELARPPTGIAISLDDVAFALGDSVEIWSLATATVVARIDALPSVQCLAFDRAATRLAAAGRDGHLWIWQLDAGRSIRP